MPSYLSSNHIVVGQVFRLSSGPLAPELDGRRDACPTASPTASLLLCTLSQMAAAVSSGDASMNLMGRNGVTQAVASLFSLASRAVSPIFPNRRLAWRTA